MLGMGLQVPLTLEMPDEGIGRRDYFKKNSVGLLHIHVQRGAPPAGFRGRAAKAEGVFTFGCQKEVAKLPFFLYFAKSEMCRYLSLYLRK